MPNLYGAGSLASTQKPEPLVFGKEPTENKIKGRGAYTLFSDEQEKMNQMLQDGLTEEKSRELISVNRKKMLKDITEKEGDTLRQMAADGIDSATSVKVIKKIRSKNMPGYKKLLKIPFDASVGAISLASEQVGNLFDFAGVPEKYGKEQVAGIKEVTGRSFVGEPGFQSGRNILGAGELVAISPTKIKPTLGGRTVQAGLEGAFIGGIDPILSKGAEATGEDIIKGTAIGGLAGASFVPALEKGVIPALTGTIKKFKGVKQAIQKEGVVGAIKKPFIGKGQKAAGILSDKVNKFNTKGIEDFTKLTGEKPGEFAVSRGLNKTGKEGLEEAIKNFNNSNKEADKGFNMIKGKFKYGGEGYETIYTIINNLEKKLGNTSNPSYGLVSNLSEEYMKKGISMADINKIKDLYSKNFKYSLEDSLSDKAIKSLNLQKSLKDFQNKEALKQGIANITDINKNTDSWKTYIDLFNKKSKTISGKKIMDLSDWVILSGGEPVNFSILAAKKFFGSKLASDLGIKTLGKQTKKPIIKTSTKDILKSNIKKENVINNNVIHSSVNVGNKSKIKKPIDRPLKGEPLDIIKESVISTGKPITKKQDIVIKKPVTLKGKTYNDINQLITKTGDKEVLLILKKQILKSNISKLNKEKLINRINNKLK